MASNKVKETMEKHGLTIGQLKKHAHFSKAVYQGVIRGKSTPAASTQMAIAEAINAAAGTSYEAHEIFPKLGGKPKEALKPEPIAEEKPAAKKKASKKKKAVEVEEKPEEEVVPTVVEEAVEAEAKEEADESDSSEDEEDAKLEE